MRLNYLLPVVLVVCAGFLPTQTASFDEFDPPPPASVVSVGFAGRDRAGGALMWMLTIQQVGRAAYADAKYPYLERWLAATVELNPELLLPYHLGTVMLITDRQRSAEMDGLLATAERVHPDVWEFPMLRGMGAYFGQLNQAAAAQHFHRVDAFPGAPPYFGKLAHRLDTQLASCGTLLTDLKSFASNSTFAREARGNANAILEECLKQELEQAVASFQMNEGRAPTIEDLLEKNYIQRRPSAPPGKCWVFAGTTASLQECQTP